LQRQNPLEPEERAGPASSSPRWPDPGKSRRFPIQALTAHESSLPAPVLIRDPVSLQRCVAAWRDAGDRIAVVPTMGALHEGHLSLVDLARESADRVVVTVFVNPAQFAPTDDLDRYPRDLEGDLKLIGQRGADLVFAPDDRAIYPSGFGTYVDPPPVASRLEGQFRPTHFRGVTTIVLKLLNLTQAQIAWFGQKDFQQLAVVRQMVRDLNHPCEIAMAPTVRSAEGLALSSRNRYLAGDEPQRALALVTALKKSAALIDEGERDGHVIMTELNQALIDGGVSSIDYAVIADPETLETMHAIRRPAVLLIAAKVGSTRLIDNWLVE
jgi:pantoate--beta-alanine ligase